MSQQRPYHYCVNLRAVLLCSGFVMLLTALSVRLIYVQKTRHALVIEQLKEKAPIVKVVPGRRGDLLDREQQPLATVQPVSDLLIEKKQIPSEKLIRDLAGARMGINKEVLASYDGELCQDLYFRMLSTQLARPLQRDPQELYERLNTDLKRLYIHKGLKSEEARELVATLVDEGFEGLVLEDRMERVYTSGDLACHVLGFVYGNLQGAAGAEAALNHLLESKDGARHYNWDKVLVDEDFPEHGKHVALTIDTTFQDLAERIVQRHYEKLGPQAIAAIFAEPSTGEILALVNRPGFTPAEGGNVQDKRTLWNTAISSTYEPGSTFKLVVHGAAINEGFVRLDTVVNCHNGRYTEDGWAKPLRDAARPRASASIRDVLAFSLNTGTFEVAQRLAPELYYNYIKSFGFGEKPAIHLTAAAKGIARHPDDGWGRSRFRLSRLGMGYELTASPLQILQVMSIICNHGDLVKMRIAREVFSADYRHSLARMEPEIVEQVLTPRTTGLLKEALITAVEEGTGTSAKVEGYVVGGKTGTAIKVENKEYKVGRTVASFMGFIGTQERPAMIGIVLVDDPQNPGKRHGGTVAGPIFKEIAEAAMYHYGIRPELPRVALQE